MIDDTLYKAQVDQAEAAVQQRQGRPGQMKAKLIQADTI